MTDEQHGRPCPNPDCDAEHAFSYNSTKQVGHCKKCNIAYPIKGVKYSGETLQMYPTKSSTSTAAATIADEPSEYRGIQGAVYQQYGVKVWQDDDGNHLRHDYVYPGGAVKTRKIPKTFTASGSMDELFGQQLFPTYCSKTITLTEGELDALSVYQMIKATKDRFVNPVVSIPGASPSGAFWKKAFEYLDSFEKIILSVDTDGPGEALANKIANLFPSKTYKVDHGEYKDANDFLVSSKAREFRDAWFNAKKYKPDNIASTGDELIKLLDNEEKLTYVPTGISGFDDKALGLMQGHFTVIKAQTGIGKTELMRYLEHKLIQSNTRFASWHLEETKQRSLLGLVSYALGENLTRLDLIKEKGMDGPVRDAVARIGDTGLYYQYWLRDGQGADDLINQIKLMKEGYGCKFVLFEPIQDVVTVSSAESKESALAELSIRLSKVAAEYNVGIITIAHTNDDDEIKYCRMIGQRASVILRLDRDKDADDEVTKNTMALWIEKNRPTSEVGSCGSVYFDSQTFTLSPF